MTNVDRKVVDDFGEEWNRFDQNCLSEAELEQQFNCYFSIFPWEKITKNSIGFDAGCGSGRWAKMVAPRVGWLYCIDPSSAIQVAQRNLSSILNCSFHRNSIDQLPMEDCSMDFGYSLGVLHHIPDTKKAMLDCVRKLKIGAPFLVYLYYSFENQPRWYRLLWQLSNLLRRIISGLPFLAKYHISQIFAIIIYYPFARSSLLAENLGINVQSWPLSGYRHRSFYSMRTDSLDRFGTKLEHRFSKSEIIAMMQQCGLGQIVFSDNIPFYCAVGIKTTNV